MGRFEAFKYAVGAGWDVGRKVYAGLRGMDHPGVELNKLTVTHTLDFGDEEPTADKPSGS